MVVRAYLHAKAEERDEVRLEHLPPERQISLKFERRGDRATQLRVVSWALWKTGRLSLGTRTGSRRTR